MVNEKVIITLLVIAILLSVVSTVVSLSAKINADDFNKPINIKVPGGDTEDQAGGIVGITIDKPKGGAA
jgi:hypothetical protein